MKHPTAIILAVLASLFAARADLAAGVEEVQDQFTIVLPEGWTVYDQTAALTERPSLHGMVFFSAEPVLSPGEKMPSPDGSGAFLRVITGDIPSFFVDRHPAGRGMSCSKLTRNARSEIELMVGRSSIFGGLARQMLLPKRPHTSLIELAGCQALKLEGRGRVGPKKTEWILDVRAVSDGKTLYLFSLRNTADNFSRNLGAYEAALATLRLSSESAGASGAAAAPAPPVFDGRAWRQGYTSRTPKMEITEYVLPAEIVEAWTELITVQRILGLGDRVGPLEVMTSVKEETLKQCPSTTWTVLRQEEEEVVYQWEYRGCRGFGEELEVAKLYRDGSSIVRVAWAIKKLPVTEETRAKWIKIIGEYR